jgi:hypothetical protein
MWDVSASWCHDRIMSGDRCINDLNPDQPAASERSDCNKSCKGELLR